MAESVADENLVNLVAGHNAEHSSGARFELPDNVRIANVSKTGLYVPLASNQWPIMFHPTYDISFAGMEKLHPFDAGKWGKIFKFLKESGMVTKDTIVQPKEATESDLRVVHTKRYLNSLKWSVNVAGIMEVPCVACVPNFMVDRYALKPFRYHVGGTILAAHYALERGWSINLGGGFHHCSADSGGGFCAYADITLAIEFLFLLGRIKKALIVDLDAHQGNGHERDFTGAANVYIMDVYNEYIYPGDSRAKQGINKSVPVRPHIKTDSYLAKLQQHLPSAIDEAKPDFILYNAGTDCLEHDSLGMMDITPKGIRDRDEFVFTVARDRQIPIAMVTSGGYQRNNARLIADSILNLRDKGLIYMPQNAP